MKHPMMKTMTIIEETPIPQTIRFTLKLPRGSEVLGVRMGGLLRDGAGLHGLEPAPVPVLVIQEPILGIKAKLVARHFLCRMTGRPIEGRYIGSFESPLSFRGFHVFEVKSPKLTREERDVQEEYGDMT